jgi:hypothetical protein
VVLSRLASRFAGRCAAAGGKNVETPHPVETLHAYSMFYFHQTNSFHANGGPVPATAGPADAEVLRKAIAGALKTGKRLRTGTEVRPVSLLRAGGERSLAREVALWRPEAADATPD